MAQTIVKAMKRCKLSKKEYREKNHAGDCYICKKCERSAKNSKKLCKPKKMS